MCLCSHCQKLKSELTLNGLPIDLMLQQLIGFVKAAHSEVHYQCKGDWRLTETYIHNSRELLPLILYFQQAEAQIKSTQTSSDLQVEAFKVKQREAQALANAIELLHSTHADIHHALTDTDRSNTDIR